MTPKRVVDVFEEARTEARTSDVPRSRARSRPIKVGRLEKEVDAVLRTKGLELNQPVEKVLNEFKRRASKLKPFARGHRLR